MAEQGSVSRARVQRRRLTPPEARLWVALRRWATEGLKFRRQHPVGPFVLDFYCPEARLAVEVDGMGHNEPDQSAKDRSRDAWLARQGIEVLRIAAEDVRVNLEGVVDFIALKASQRLRL